MSAVLHAGGIEAVSLAERPDLAARIDDLDVTWPAFMRQDRVVRRYWSSLTRTKPQFQVALVDVDDRVVAKGHAIPIEWDGDTTTLPEGIDAVLGDAIRAPARVPTTLCALGAVVAPERRGDGLGAIVLRSLRGVAARHGLRGVISPARPTAKSLYPLTPIDRYASWTDADGLPFDPWLRVHARLGGRIVRMAPRSMTVTGTVADWERWAGMRFPDSGRYVVPGALSPVTIDRQSDRGRHEEPNVWVHHSDQEA